MAEEKISEPESPASTASDDTKKKTISGLDIAKRIDFRDYRPPKQPY